MEQKLKKILRALSLELRHILEGAYDDQRRPMPGDLDRRLNQLGVWPPSSERVPEAVDEPVLSLQLTQKEQEALLKPVEELPQLSDADKRAREQVDAYIKYRDEAGVLRAKSIKEFVRESAYTWANRLLTLRCMEARGIIDEVILQKDAYAGRSLVHHRFAGKNPGAVRGEDDGLFAVLFDQFAERARELPELFDPASPAVSLRPSPAALKRCIALLSGREALRGQDPATDDVFAAPDALGWTYQYYQADEKDRVDDLLKTKKGFKCEGADIVPKTSLYTESYIVKFLVQNSLGATWMGMHPESPLAERWEYFVRDADRVPAKPKPVNQITFLDPACGSGHFLLEAFDLLYVMYEAEGHLTTPREIAASILNENLFGIDIDGCAVQIAHAALWMKAREKAPDLAPGDLTTFHHHLVATNIRLPKGADHIEAFLEKHPEDQPFRPALEVIFSSLGNAPELGSLLKLEEPLDRRMRELKADYDRKQASGGIGPQLGLYGKAPVQHRLPVGTETYEAWRDRVLAALIAHFAAESSAADAVEGFFGESAGKGLILADLLRRSYDVVAANPPYMGSGSMGSSLKSYVQVHYVQGKRDLYAAFILRCRELAAPSGRVAMVTQQSWMFLRSFADLRATQDPDAPPILEQPRGVKRGKRKTSKDTQPAFAGLLRETTIETIAHLGPHAFSEIGGEVVNTVLFVLSRYQPADDHRLTAFRLIGPKSPQEKDDLLRAAIAGSAVGTISTPAQSRFLSVAQAPLCYWLRERFFELQGGNSLRDIAITGEGLSTSNNNRFLRCFWEIMQGGPRWSFVTKGGRYGRWAGLDFFCVDWEYAGLRVKRHIVERYPYFHGNYGFKIKDERHYFTPALTYSTMARGSLGVRLVGDVAYDNSGSFVSTLDQSRIPSLSQILNCRLISYLLRTVNQSMTFKYRYHCCPK